MTTQFGGPGAFLGLASPVAPFRGDRVDITTHPTRLELQAACAASRPARGARIRRFLRRDR